MVRPSPIKLESSSKLPGGFETDEEFSPVKANCHDATSHSRQTSGQYYNAQDLSSEPPPEHPPDPNMNHASSPDPPHPSSEGAQTEADKTFDEEEMTKRLMDVEPSFYPESSSPAPLPSESTTMRTTRRMGKEGPKEEEENTETEPSFYQTPYPTLTDRRRASQNDERQTDHVDTFALETMSSPTTAALQRGVNRMVSIASLGGYETADEAPSPSRKRSLEDLYGEAQETPRLIPEAADKPQLSISRSSTPIPEKASNAPQEPRSPASPSPASEVDPASSTRRRRPKHLNSRFASQRSSHSSYTTNNSSGHSNGDDGLGADYALQTGGGASLSSSTSNHPAPDMLRSISMASIASGITDPEDRTPGPRQSTSNRPKMPTESSSGEDDNDDQNYFGEIDRSATPKGRTTSLQTPTETVINQRVQNFEVPETIARKFQASNGRGSPSENTRPSTSSGVGTLANSVLPTPVTNRIRNLALKEQGNVVDKLQKENFKLKMQVYFMDQKLNAQSDEAVKAMIAENVDLNTYKITARKEIRALNKMIRELTFKANERDATLQARANQAKEEGRKGRQLEERWDQMEHDVQVLTQRNEEYEITIERLRDEGREKDADKRRREEMMRNMSERRRGGSDIGLREEVDMWKDLLESETARREQADVEMRRLREENWRLRGDQNAGESDLSPNHSRRHSGRPSNGKGGSNGYSVPGSVTLVDQLRHDNAELQQQLGAQASMLTSRNKEKERLYQEIEDLKMQRHNPGGRSSTGDSIFERSASRAKGPPSSGGDSQIRGQKSTADLEALQERFDQQRDEMAAVKMERNQLAIDLNVALDELDALAVLQEDFAQLHHRFEEKSEEGRTNYIERYNAIAEVKEKTRQFDELKEEAQNDIAVLEEDLDTCDQRIRALEEELAKRNEETQALRNEVRMTSEGLDRVEADVQAKVRRVKELEVESEELNQELEAMEKGVLETSSKNEKLTIELESRQGECVFLREEQDGCMIKIGELEGALKISQANLTGEGQRVRDLNARLNEERHQRETVGSQEKQDVQRMINDLNREAGNAQEEARKLTKAVNIRDSEIRTWKDKMMDLETSLREVLGDTAGSKNGCIQAITRLQSSVAHLTEELSLTKHALSIKETTLQRREALLESSGLESDRLAKLLEKERSARRAEQAQQEHWQATHQHTSGTLNIRDTRIKDLEAGRQNDHKKLHDLEQKLKAQLDERNTLLLGLWHRLAALCGTDWQHQNSLVSGHLPTVEVVSSMLPGFQKNVMLALKTVESLIGGFRARIRAVERDLAKDYAQLEHNLDIRIKRLDRLETQAQMNRISSAASATPELARAKGENRLLKAEVEKLRQREDARRAAKMAMSIERTSSNAGSMLPPPIEGSPGGSRPGTGLASKLRIPGGSLTRHHSSSAVETLESQGLASHAQDVNPVISAPIEVSQQRWVHRLKELERRLKAEREGRLLDRNGARKRLDEARMENEDLRAERDRQVMRLEAVEAAQGP